MTVSQLRLAVFSAIEMYTVYPISVELLQLKRMVYVRNLAKLSLYL